MYERHSTSVVRRIVYCTSIRLRIKRSRLSSGVCTGTGSIETLKRQFYKRMDEPYSCDVPRWHDSFLAFHSHELKSPECPSRASLAEKALT
jgi:hypothetical protein